MTSSNKTNKSMLYNIVTEQVSQWTVLHELLMNSSVHMSSVILYVRCSFFLVVSFNGVVLFGNLLQFLRPDYSAVSAVTSRCAVFFEDGQLSGFCDLKISLLFF
jgi:hypothetical protein